MFGAWEEEVVQKETFLNHYHPRCCLGGSLCLWLLKSTQTALVIGGLASNK